MSQHHSRLKFETCLSQGLPRRCRIAPGSNRTSETAGRGRGGIDALELSSCRGYKTRDQYPQSVSFTFERNRHIISTHKDFIDLYLTEAGRTDTPRVAPLYTWLTCSPTSCPQQSLWLWVCHFCFATPYNHARSSCTYAHMDSSFISFL
jgi:hypothetical protein